jgi:hypothetical protein
MPTSNTHENSMNRVVPGIQKLYKYFNDQLSINLNSLEMLLAFDTHKGMSNKMFAEIRQLIDEIHDLAMVHGYDSIEAISDKISASARNLRSKDRQLVADARDNVNSGIKAIRDIFTLTRGTEESPWNAEFTIVQNVPDEQILKNIGNLATPAKDPSKSEIFDIKEVDSLMSLVDDSKSKTGGTPAKENPDATVGKETNTENNLSERNLNETFDEVFREDALENLGEIQSALHNIRKGTGLSDATLKLKSAFGALSELAESFDVQPLVEPLVLINKICDEEVSYNVKPIDELIELLLHSELVIREFVEACPESDSSLAEFSDNLNRLFVSQKVQDESPNHTETQADSENQIKPDDSKKKAQTEDPKEQIRKKWILQKH